jgi:hypothetical protein
LRAFLVVERQQLVIPRHLPQKNGTMAFGIQITLLFAKVLGRPRSRPNETSATPCARCDLIPLDLMQRHVVPPAQSAPASSAEALRYSPRLGGIDVSSRRRKPAPHPQQIASPFFMGRTSYSQKSN